MSFKVEFNAGPVGWISDPVRLQTREEAEAYARFTKPLHYRIAPSADAANYSADLVTGYIAELPRVTS